jgi:hypothetical protein
MLNTFELKEANPEKVKAKAFIALMYLRDLCWVNSLKLR